MEKTEMMKRYEEETGKHSVIMKFMAGGQALESKDFPKIGSYEYSTEYIAWLESKANISDEAIEAFQEIIRNQCDEISELKAQLTWRPASELPEEEGWCLCKTQYADNTFGVETVFFNGKNFIYSRVIAWLPIPPAPDTVSDGREAM